MRRILFLNRYFHPDHSATSQLLTELAVDLVAGGERVCVITSRQRYDDPDARLSPVEKWQGIDILRVRTSRFGRFHLGGRAIDYLSFHLAVIPTLLRQIQPGDLVVAMTDPPLISLVAAWITRLKKGVLVNWIQDLFPEVAQALGVAGMNTPLAALPRRLRNASLRAARVNVVLSDPMATRLRAEGIPQAAIRVIHNWADKESIRPLAPEENPLRAEWGLTDRCVIGYSGNLGRAHEFATAIEAARLLRDPTDPVWLFIGGGARHAGLRHQAAAAGIDDGMRFLPYQPKERLSWSLGVADIHWISLLPELEGMIVPSKFYGIAAAGRPILFIGAENGAIAQELRRHACGFTVPPGDAEQLAERIRLLRNNPELRREMGLRARRMLEERFDRAHAVTAWRALLQEVSGQRLATPP
ncbi:MAG: glycosyltransferase family 4 protein [Magnetococcales bacterium]|nr:glycosyltransferase family 4 protein [Magnetococcales bacterium]